MNILTTKEKHERLDQLIRLKATGTPQGVVVICDFTDFMAWNEILCGVEPL